MIDQERFAQLMQRVVADADPDQAELLEMNAPALMKQLVAGKDIRKEFATPTGEGLGFEPSLVLHGIQHGIHYASVVFTAYHSIKKLYDQGRALLGAGSASQTLAAAWKKGLVDEGVDPERADHIVGKFSSDLAKVIMHK